jgi:hypothetical protein
MGWEKRGKGMYYYRKRREGKHVVSEYKGLGSLAHLYSELDLDNKKHPERKYHHAQWKQQNDEITGINKEIDQLDEIIDGLVRAVLLTSGYHPHKGQWRKSRYGK